MSLFSLIQSWRQLRWAAQMPKGHAALLFRDLAGWPGRNRSNRDALSCALDWLCLAQDHSADGGVAGTYHLFEGWSGSYAETTGYIAETFFNAAEWLQRPDLAERAQRMVRWLLSVQLPEGSFPAGIEKRGCEPRPAVFNTGQVLLGLLAGYHHTGNNLWRNAAVRASEWLCDVQEEDGSWVTAAYQGIPHAYYTHVAWPLAAWGCTLDDARFIEAAERHVQWVLSLRKHDGWFSRMEMIPGQPVELHPIAYTLRGLWECGQLLDNAQCREAVTVASHRLIRDLDKHQLTGAYQPGWQRQGQHTCLTGVAQLACLWLRMNADEPDAELRDAANRAVERVISLQDLDNPSPQLRGGLRGSYPITGEYMPWCIINWGTKFLADALLFQHLDPGRLSQAFSPARNSMPTDEHISEAMSLA